MAASETASSDLGRLLLGKEARSAPDPFQALGRSASGHSSAQIFYGWSLLTSTTNNSRWSAEGTPPVRLALAALPNAHRSIHEGYASNEQGTFELNKPDRRRLPVGPSVLLMNRPIRNEASRGWRKAFKVLISALFAVSSPAAVPVEPA